MTTVHNINKANDLVYIGRGMRTLRQSIYHNPFKLGIDGDRKEVIAKFATYWYAPEQQELRYRAIEELAHKRLGCWCKPLDCHGDIIAGYVNWKRQSSLFL